MPRLVNPRGELSRALALAGWKVRLEPAFGYLLLHSVTEIARLASRHDPEPFNCSLTANHMCSAGRVHRCCSTIEQPLQDAGIAVSLIPAIWDDTWMFSMFCATQAAILGYLLWPVVKGLRQEIADRDAANSKPRLRVER